MGFGLAGIGTAVGAATEGYMRGEKHRSDMEDAEARRSLTKIQTEEGNIRLGQLRREEKYQQELANLYKDEESTPDAPAAAAAPAPAAGAIATPGEAPVDGAPAGFAPAAGIATPGAKTSTGSKGDLSDLSKMQRLIQKRQQLDLSYGKIDEIKAMQGMKAFKQLQDEGVIDAMEYFRRTGDREGAITRMNSTGQIKLDPNAQFSIVDKEIAPGVKVPNVVVTSPDGKHSFNQYDAMVSALNPKDALSFRTETGIKLADLALKATAEDNLRKYRQDSLAKDNRLVDATIEKYKNDNMVSMKKLELMAKEREDYDAARALKLRQESSGKALDAILRVNGINPNMKENDLALVGKERRAQIEQARDRAFEEHTVWEMNVSAKNEQAFAPSEANRVLAQIKATPADKFGVDSDGVFITYQGKKVYAPIDPNSVLAAQKAKSGAGGGGAPTPAAQPGGVNPPSVQQQRQMTQNATSYIATQKASAERDNDLIQLKMRQDYMMRNGRNGEVSTIAAQRAQILRDRYNLTPLGGIADPSKIGQQ